MSDCIECQIARISGPCPHDAIRAVEGYGREQYERGLRLGLCALFDVLATVDGHQEHGKRRRPMPLAVIRSALRGRACEIIRALSAVNHPLSEEWKAEAGKAFDGEKA